MERIGKKKYRCKYPKCNNWYYSNIKIGFINKHFYTYPSSIEIKKLWLAACNVDNSANIKNHRICEDHFELNSFRHESSKKLKCNAVPKSFSATDRNITISKQLIGEKDVENSTNSSSINCTCLNPCSSSSICMCLPDLTYLQKFNGSSILVEHNYFIPPNELVDEPQQNINYIHPESCEVTINFENLQDDNYLMPSYESWDNPKSNIDFLTRRDGILNKAGFSKQNLTPKSILMQKIHRNTISKISQLRKTLQHEPDIIKSLRGLYNVETFKNIEQNLNVVSQNFMTSRLRNIGKWIKDARYCERDTAFALSLHQRSPALYQYLRTGFFLPSPRSLKYILYKIPFETGINDALFAFLKTQVDNLKVENRCCALIFDEIRLSPGFRYERYKQTICGFEDLGSLGRTRKGADHALVFMVRGIRKQWKQIVAYYFTAKTIAPDSLVFLIKEIIGQLQKIGLIVVATICDQAKTNQSALTKLCSQNHVRQSPYYFFVNEREIATIYDVPHLLKSTRNSLFKCKIEFEPRKFAKFSDIQTVFDIDRQKKYSAFTRLKKEDFNFLNSEVKLKVRVASAQLSNSVAGLIDTYSSFTNMLPSDSIYTAEFAKLMDNIFDSLNSSSFWPQDEIKYKRALSSSAPHLELWSKFLRDLTRWKLIDLESGLDVTSQYSFIRGWDITIRSIMFLWSRLKNFQGFGYLNMRGLNQDPLENFFSNIRRHGFQNSNPTCHEFVAALKTIVVNKFVASSLDESNCEDDMCQPLTLLSHFLTLSETEERRLLKMDTLNDFLNPKP